MANTSKSQKEIYKQVKERSGGLCEKLLSSEKRDTAHILVSLWRCCKPAVAIHHIGGKGMGGTKRLFKLDELIDLCDDCHRKIHG